MNSAAASPEPDVGARSEAKYAVLRPIAWLLLAAPPLYLTLGLSLGVDDPRQAVAPLAIFFLAAGALLLLRRGRLRAAAALIVYGAFAAILLHAILSGAGIHTPQLAALPLGILLAGWMLGRRHAIVFTALAVALGLVLALLAQGGTLPGAPQPALLIWLPRAVAAVGVCILTLYLVGDYEARLDEVRRLGVALRTERDQLRQIAENVPALIFHGDRELRCRFANRQFADFFHGGGVPLEGMHLRDILGETVFAAALPNLERVLAGEAVLLEDERLTVAGDRRLLDISLVPERDAGGVVGFYALKRDVTELKQAQRRLAARERRLHAIADNVPAMIAHVSAELLLRYANRRFLDFFGLRLAEALGNPLATVLGREAFAGIRPELECALRGERTGRRLQVRDAAGRQRTIEADFVPDRDEEGHALGLYALLRDVTEQNRIEEALRRSEHKFAVLFRAAPLAIDLSRVEDGRLLDVNEAFLRLFGWGRQEVIGRTSLELGLWSSPDAHHAFREALLREGRMINWAADFRLRSGEIRHMLLSAERLDFEGEACALCIFSDITELKRTQEALQDSQTRLIEAQRIGQLGSWEYDLRADRFAWLSTTIDEIFEIEPGTRQVSYADFLRAVHPEDRPTVEQRIRQCIARGGEDELDYRLRLRGGRIKHLRSRFRLHCDEEDRPQRLTGITQDVTALVEARQTLERLNAELEQRVAERTAELRAANRELESFAYSISHDLRAPLRGIDGFAHLLAEEYAERLDDTGRGYLERVRRAAQRMGALIDDILELSRVSRQQMRRVPVDLSRLAAELIEERRQTAPEHRVECLIAPGCQAFGDPQLLRVLLQNLLENAWKYSAKEPAPSIAFGCETNGGETVFFVRDNGVGFDMQYADRLFVPFQRLHRPEEFEGTGIGLATVSRIVHRHGGRVWIESAPGKGTTVRFVLGEKPAGEGS